ncbi:phosphotransferase [Formosa sp. PL04]|uniref:phosphotransferase n=1 Tax=Formosa sp. PL04 TaxID=3081755 RepID=UPI002982A53D|nr:phosphotransferase [Formosa sp. PL04]MDW5290403.1 phosphotransferase [Formosa sp. PL04]
MYCHDWRSKTEILEEFSLLNELKQHGVGISYPISDIKGEFLQDIKAPEGLRYASLFSFAEGDKIRFMDENTCFSIGKLMAKIHKITENKFINRIQYSTETLLDLPYTYANKYFKDTLTEMQFIKQKSEEISKTFQAVNKKKVRYGIVHLDIWYDNMSVKNSNEITIFDFDFCGNGWFVYDVGYFCKQLFHIETDKAVYESKKARFLEGYNSVLKLSEEELELIPSAGIAVWVFYLGVQSLRFDWSNIFLTENYLKMYIGRIQSWNDYYNTV